jgi:hypothetical protein
MIDEDDFWSNWWNEIWQGKPKYSEKSNIFSSFPGFETGMIIPPPFGKLGSDSLVIFKYLKVL